MKTRRMAFVAGLAALALLILSAAGPAGAGEMRGMAKGQTMYAPSYPFVPYGPKSRPMKLNSTLCIRNLDIDDPITVGKIAYLDETGKELKQYLSQPLIIPPLGAVHYVAPEMDAKDMGHGFLLVWRAGKVVTAPLAQVVIVGTGGQQGISFINEAVVIK